MSLSALKRFARRARVRVPWVSLLLTAVALIIHIYYPLRLRLIYARAALQDGDLWRLLSCHWVHLNEDHLLWSAMTFLVLGSICEIMNRTGYVITVAISAVLIPIAIWFGMPDLKTYGGLSGLDCALYTLLIFLFIKREWKTRSWQWLTFYAVLLALLLGKIFYEVTSGLTIFVNIAHTNMVTVPLAHLVGGLVGIAVGTSILGRKKIAVTKTASNTNMLTLL